MSDLLHARLQSAFGETYRIERELGGGGMSRVFVAVETSLGRHVVVKVLPEDFSAGVSVERFAREVRLAANLQCPQIVPVLTVGDAGDTPYYIMPLVEGESLRARLTRDGPLPTVRALDILRDVAKALDYAHGHGVIHRDIKPENILITGSSAVVTDFGIAKAITASRVSVEHPSTNASSITQIGSSVGTPAYMAPEQAAGDATDHRADLYAWGMVAYEILAGRHPFADRQTAQQMLAAQMSERPRPLAEVEPERPAALAAVVMRCLEKNADDRPKDAGEVLAILESVATGGHRHAATPVSWGGRARMWTRGPRAFAAATGLLVVAATGWFAVQRSRVAWVRSEALPRIQQLAESRRFDEAFSVAQRALRILPRDSDVVRAALGVSRRITITSNPPGARVYRQEFTTNDTAWQFLGETPLDSATVPAGGSRLKLEKGGFRPYYLGAAVSLALRLSPANPAATDTGAGEMVAVPAGVVNLSQRMPGLAHLAAHSVARYEVGRFEVTNRQFKRFVDAGGYRRRELWDGDIRRGGAPVKWEDAIASFKDKTGRPAPATWEVGDFPDGQGDYPVTGVSWYEAQAYAEFAGAKLPTVYHFVRAASTENGGAIIPLSNIDSKGLAPVGKSRGISAWGLYDIAGNAREWIANANGSDRLMLGGAWNDAPYMFYLANNLDPFDRSATNGFRVARYRDDSAAVLEAPVERRLRDFAKERPASDELFAAYRRFYDYDRTPLDARVERVDTAESWIRQRVTFAAAYGGERVIAYLYLPRNGRPPYQTVVLYPGANTIGNGADAPSGPFPTAFLAKSGRALLYPIYKATFERRDAMPPSDFYPKPTSFYRDHVLMWAKDLRRSVDYLYTRPDVDTARVAYEGNSWGGYAAGVMLAIEPRFKTAVLACPGLAFERPQPEVDQLNFLPHITVPVLMVNGRYDAVFPLESSAQPMFRLLGTRFEDKRQVIVDSGHCPPTDVFVSEALAWLDKYLGPVR